LTTLKYNREYENLVPAPSEDEYEALKASIAADGQFYPIIVNDKLEILDGHTRNQICYVMNIEPKYIIKKFANKILEKKFVIESNLKRRHLNNYQKIELGIPLLEIERELAKQRQLSKLKNSKTSLASIEANEGKSAQIVAQKLGVSTSTFERGEKIYKKAPEKIKAQVRKGTLSINSAYKLITRESRNLPTVPLPKGEFDVIYADPALRFENRNIRGSADHHYDTMTLANICNLQIPAAKNAVLFLWIPSSMFFDEQEVDADVIDSTINWILQRWGFKAKTFFVWVKDRIGTGSYLRNQHENLIIAYKGKMPTPLKLFPSVIESPREEHSKKPEIVYDMIEQMYPKRNYLELWARSKHSDKWQVWGNEVVTA
jgi:N6-adenosine-specific RNA methylase IME4/ParB-like chromosome segregation protein Spo0J